MIGLRAHHQQQRQQQADRTRNDISRLLDPSYATSYYRQQPQTGLYVDAQGDLHDPDYRPFPIITNSGRGLRSSHWDDDSAVLSEDEDDLPEDYYTSYFDKRSSHSPTKSRQQQPYYRRSTSPSSGAILTGSPISSFSSSSSSSASSSPSVLSRAQSPFDEESPKEMTAVCRIAASLKRKRRRSSSVSSTELDNHMEWLEQPTRFVQEEVLEEEAEEEEEVHEEEKKRVPTRSQNLKKQWRVMSLTIQFGLFRARKRVKSLI